MYSCNRIFGHMTTFWIFAVKTALILKSIDKYIKILALACFILRSVCVKTMKRAEALSYFVVKILYEKIFGHVTTHIAMLTLC